MKELIIEIEVGQQPIDEVLLVMNNHISLHISDLEMEHEGEELDFEDVEIEMESLDEETYDHDDYKETSFLEDLDLDFDEISNSI